MRISLNWLKEYIDLDVGVDELAHEMTMLGLEIEAVERPGADISHVYVGEILSIEPHPDADKLVVCRTDIGRDHPLQIVCGAKNMRVGDRVPTIVAGGALPGGFKITRRAMRGIESQGMMCSAKELGLGEDQSGLMILEDRPEIGTDIRVLLGLDDVIFEIEVIPNRGDWASMIGVARELAVRYGKTIRVPAISLTESATPASSLSSVTIDDPVFCPRYIGRVLTGVKVGPSPDWLCRRLIAAGQRPINNIVDITNYVLLETGHPLHAFDYEKLAENRIVVRRARSGETITTLDGEVRKLTEDMLVIADAREAQAVAGVMGGADSEVGESTTKIFLESAYFHPPAIRRAARGLGLLTEAAMHFQRGADPEMAVYAINRAAAMMQELAGAEIAAGQLDAYPNPVPQREVTLRYARTKFLLGTEIPPEFQRNTLQALGFEPMASTSESCTFRAPTWRHDVSLEADLIEEVARFYGYDKIDITLPRVRPAGQVFAPEEAHVRKLRSFLVGQGLTELFNWTFSNAEDVSRAGLPDDCLNMVTLRNPLSEKHATMRSSLIPGLLNTAAYNVNHGVPEMAAFEIGPVYIPLSSQDLPLEPLRLGVVLYGTADLRHWSRPQASVDFYDLKGYVEACLDFFGLSAEFVPGTLGTFQTGQCAIVNVRGGKSLGHLGKVNYTVLKAYDIGQNIYLAELDLALILSSQAPVPVFAPIPAFPPSLRDLAVLVDATVPAGTLIARVREAGGRLLASVQLFDVYHGEQIPAGKKSIAMNLTFQAPDRTLTDSETDKAIEKIVRCLKRDFEAERR